MKRVQNSYALNCIYKLGEFIRYICACGINTGLTIISLNISEFFI